MTSSEALTGSDSYGGRRRAAEGGPPAGYGRSASAPAQSGPAPSAPAPSAPAQSAATRSPAARSAPARSVPEPVAVQAEPAAPAAAAVGEFVAGQGQQGWQQQSFNQSAPAGYEPPRSPVSGSRPGQPASAASAPVGGRTRSARLRLSRLDPWSVMKVSFVLSVALGIISIIGMAVLWMILDQMGVFASLSKTVGDITSSTNSGGFNLQSYLSFGNVFGFSLIIALIDIVLVTALSTLGTFLYNLGAGMVGGIEVTLAEDD